MKYSFGMTVSFAFGVSLAACAPSDGVHESAEGVADTPYADLIADAPRIVTGTNGTARPLEVSFGQVQNVQAVEDAFRAAETFDGASGRISSHLPAVMQIEEALAASLNQPYDRRREGVPAPRDIDEEDPTGQAPYAPEYERPVRMRQAQERFQVVFSRRPGRPLWGAGDALLLLDLDFNAVVLMHRSGALAVTQLRDDDEARAMSVLLPDGGQGAMLAAMATWQDTPGMAILFDRQGPSEFQVMCSNEDQSGYLDDDRVTWQDRICRLDPLSRGNLAYGGSNISELRIGGQGLFIDNHPVGENVLVNGYWLTGTDYPWGWHALFDEYRSLPKIY